MKVKATGVRKPGESGSRFATIGIRGDGFQLPLPSTIPIGTGTSSPSEVFTQTDTARVESRPRFFVAKKRSVGSARPTHTAGVIALLPDGRRSERLCEAPPTFHGSLPETTVAPRRSVHPVAAGSNPPFLTSL